MTNQLRELRKKKSMTQMDLAQKSGVGRTVIARFETGRTVMSTKNLAKICEVLHCKMEDVLKEAG